MPAVPRFCQMALTTLNLAFSSRFYNDGFGFRHAGGNYASGPSLGALQGLPGSPTLICGWSVDSQDNIQLEVFQYAAPLSRPRPACWRPCDIGYARMGLHVADFDGTLARLKGLGASPLTEVAGNPGCRRACVLDPDGNIIELMEDDPRPPEAMGPTRPAIPVAVRSVTLSVPDLARSRRFFVEALGLPVVEGLALHTPDMEALWGLPDAQRQVMLLAAGDVFIEVVEYVSPKGSPWPEGRLLSDQGFLNMALRYPTRDDLLSAYRALLAAGYTSNNVPNEGEVVCVAYVNDDQGFCVELLYYPEAMARALGFVPLFEGFGR